MNPISRKPFLVFSFFAQKTPGTHFRTSHNLSFSTQTSQNSVPSYPSRRHEEESRNVRVSVWWDFENCNLPGNVNVVRVAQCITNAIRANGIKGPIQITAFGDVMQLSRANQEVLSATGINLSHIPSGGKNSADRSLLVDLMSWVSQNPPPAHLFLISGDRDFAGVLHRLRMNNYNILLASTDSVPSVLCNAASIVWQWNTLIRGENLTGKYFNQPPDGPYNSWYGHYKAPLEYPFAAMERSPCSHSDELSESGSESKHRSIPKTVIKQIRRVLFSHPEGIPIAELRLELAKSNLIVDKDLYGYKKFSRFLLAMPHVLKLQSATDGQILVHGIKPKIYDGSHPNVYFGPVSNTGEHENGYVAKPNGTTEKSEREISEVQKLPKSEQESSPIKAQEVQEKDQTADVPKSTKKNESPSPFVEVVDVSKDSKRRVRVAADAELGPFRRIWRNWFRSKDGDSEKVNCSKEKEISDAKKGVEENDLSTDHLARSVSPVSPSSHETTIERRIARSSNAIVGKYSQEPSIFSQILRCCKFWKSTDSDYVAKESDKVNQQTNDVKKDDVFSKESFWNELEIFMKTSRGSALVLQSRTRVHLADNLQKQGPSVLRSVSEGDLLHLVNLLISDKKWVEESHSETYPFKVMFDTVMFDTGKDQSNDHPPRSGVLSSIFQDGERPSSLQELREKKHQNPPHTGVPQSISQRDCLGKSREQMLIDCRKLVDHILKEYPEGFNMGSFRKLFLEKYGYDLDLQKLGYRKLVGLLQVMPGVTIESNCIYPFEVSKSHPGSNAGPVGNSDSVSLDGSRKDDDSESPWEELGPVANASIVKDEIHLVLTGMPKTERTEPTHPVYETSGEDDLSDSEEEWASSKTDIEAKSLLNQKDSSLLQILDSWYSSSNDNTNIRENAVENTLKSDCSQNGSNEFVTKPEGHILDHARKQKPSKSYSFVSEQLGDN